MGQFFKMWWMLTWRAYFLGIFLNLYQNFTPVWLFLGAVAGVLAFLGYTIRIFPLAQLLRGRRPIYRFREGSKRKITGPYTVVPQFPQRPRIPEPTQLGRMTGFEPSKLTQVAIAWSTRTFGTPGAGLSNAQHFSAANISLGQQGEQNFAKALSVAKDSKGTTLLEKFDTFWSVAIPSEDSAWIPDHRDTDVDAIILAGNKLILIDLKNYKSGGITYVTEGDMLVAVDDATGAQVGEAKKMSRNMELALERFKKHFPLLTVEAKVVFMPTDRGESTVTGVYWPGYIMATPLSAMLATLKYTDGKRSHVGEQAIPKLHNLIKS